MADSEANPHVLSPGHSGEVAEIGSQGRLKPVGLTPSSTYRAPFPFALLFILAFLIVVFFALVDLRRPVETGSEIVAFQHRLTSSQEVGSADARRANGPATTRSGTARGVDAVDGVRQTVFPADLAMTAVEMPEGPWSDCPDCPVMVTVPAGSFLMGSPASDPLATAEEGPQHEVTLAEAFAISRHPVTFAEWQACVADGGCDGYRPEDAGWGRGDRPVINVGWNDARSYVRWLSEKTGKPYRLPTEAEWEYAARGGTDTPYWWGDEIGRNNANCRNCSDFAGRRTVPIASFRQNPFGLYDVHGNVWQWVGDCWRPSYGAAAGPGSTRSGDGGCGRRVIRGGSWDNTARFVRAAARTWASPSYRNNLTGFRVARSLEMDAIGQGRSDGAAASRF